MYRIKKDKRIAMSAFMICSSMKEIMKEKGFDSISVSEVADRSGISRATFYRLFDSTRDVLQYICDSIEEKARNEYNKHEISTAYDLAIFAFNFIFQCSDDIEAILKSGKQEMLYRSFQEFFNGFMPLEEDITGKTEMVYIKEAMNAGLASILFVWLKRGKKESAEDLLAIFKNFMHAMANKSNTR